MERQYKGRLDSAMMVEYIWSLICQNKSRYRKYRGSKLWEEINDIDKNLSWYAFKKRYKKFLVGTYKSND